MSKTLLEKAKAINLLYSRNVKEPTDEEIELVFGWIRGEVGTTQMAGAMTSNDRKIGKGNMYYFITATLRQAYRKGYIEIKK